MHQAKISRTDLIAENTRLREQVKILEDRLQQADFAVSETHSHIPVPPSLLYTEILVAVLDPDFNFKWVNPAYARADNREPDFFPGKNHFDLYPNAENQAIFQQVVDSGESYYVRAKPFEYLLNPERGTTYWDWSLTPIVAEKKRVGELVLTLINVTEKVKAEIALQESEAKLQLITNSFNDIIFTVDQQHRHTAVFGSWVEKSGLTPDHFIGKTAIEILGEEAGQIHLRANEKALQGENLTYEWSLTREGHTNYFQTSLSPLLNRAAEIVGVVGVGRDITALKESMNELDLFKSIIEKSNEAIVISDSKGTVCYINHAHEKLFGYSPAQSFAMTMHDFFPPGSHPVLDSEVIPSVAKGQTWQGEIIARRANGELFPLWGRADGLLDHFGNYRFSFGIMHDITDKRQIEKNLAESEQKFRALFEQALNPIFLVNQQGYYVDANPAGLNFLECRLAELRTKCVWDFAPPQKLAQQKAEHAPFTGSRTLETEYMVNGTVKTLLLNVVPIQLNDGVYLFGIGQEISGRKQMEAEIRRLLEQTRADAHTKAELLSEVNHRVGNNMMMLIAILSQEMMQAEDKNELEKKHVIQKIVHRIKGLADLHRLLQQAQWGHINLAYLAYTVINNVLEIIPPDKKVNLDIQSSEIMVSPKQAQKLALIFNELATNSIKYALSDRQEIAINLNFEEKSAEHEHYGITYRDTGPGFPPRILEENETNLGLSLIGTMLADLDGQMILRNNGGAEVEIHF